MGKMNPDHLSNTRSKKKLINSLQKQKTNGQKSASKRRLPSGSKHNKPSRELYEKS
jgi:N-acetylmuramoyl-L-alanine amidase CwlA